LENLLRNIGDDPKSRLVVFGEEHGNFAAHRLQLELLARMLRQSNAVTLSLEMLDKERQDLADEYLRNGLQREGASISGTDEPSCVDEATSAAPPLQPLKPWSEESVLCRAGWGNWFDYAPFVRIVKLSNSHEAKDHCIVAANAPRRLVRIVSQLGREGLNDALVASPRDAAFLAPLPWAPVR